MLRRCGPPVRTRFRTRFCSTPSNLRTAATPAARGLARGGQTQARAALHRRPCRRGRGAPKRAPGHQLPLPLPLRPRPVPPRPPPASVPPAASRWFVRRGPAHSLRHLRLPLWTHRRLLAWARHRCLVAPATWRRTRTAPAAIGTQARWCRQHSRQLQQQMDYSSKGTVRELQRRPWKSPRGGGAAATAGPTMEGGESCTCSTSAPAALPCDNNAWRRCLLCAKRQRRPRGRGRRRAQNAAAMHFSNRQHPADDRSKQSHQQLLADLGYPALPPAHGSQWTLRTRKS